MRMIETGFPQSPGWTLYPKTSAERLLLDRLWGLLQSENFPEWKVVSLGMGEPTDYYSITGQAQVAMPEGFSTPSTFPEAPLSEPTITNLVTLTASPERF